jgi:hypothetical protein
MASKYSIQEKHSFTRAMHHLKHGALHRHFGVSEDKPLTQAQKEEAANSSNPHLRKMGQFALNAAKWHHGK